MREKNNMKVYKSSIREIDFVILNINMMFINLKDK